MTQNYKKLMAAELLGKYERSKGFREGTKESRKISFPFTNDKLRDYHYGTYTQKAEIMRAARSLEDAGHIRIEWIKGEKDSVIKEIILCPEGMDNLYNIAGIRPKSDEISVFGDHLTEVKERLFKIGLKDTVEEWIALLGVKRLSAVLPKDEEIRTACLNALSGLADLSDDMDERMFSLRYLGNSKAFGGKVKAATARVLRLSSHGGVEQEETDAETLEKFGVLETGSDFHIAGPIKLLLANGMLDVNVAKGGLAISIADVKDARATTIHADTLLSVENLAVFREILRRGLPERVILLYSGGFYSQRKLRLIGNIRDAMVNSGTNARFFHWGDIDLGGIRIFLHLKNTIPELRPYNMDSKTMKKYLQYADDFVHEYGAKLVRYKESGVLEFIELIEIMLKSRRRLEQEAILSVDSAPVSRP